MEVFGSGNGDVTNGTMDISTFTPPTVMPIGSLEGTGLVKLGQNTLSVGSNNDSTTFDGIINDAGGGSLTKTGSGTFTLSGANTYTGKTTVAAGTLLVTNRTGSATGTGPVIVNGGVLGGTGTDIRCGHHRQRNPVWHRLARTRRTHWQTDNIQTDYFQTIWYLQRRSRQYRA